MEEAKTIDRYFGINMRWTWCVDWQHYSKGHV